MRKNLKIIKLNGGLGNQLFQYSLGLCLSQNKNYNIVYDKSYYQKRVDAPVIQIEKVFKIKLKNLNNEAIDFKTKIFTNRFFIFILNKINPKILENKGVFIEKNKIFDSRILKPHKYFFFLGYFQSEDYFLRIKKKIKEKINLKKKINKDSYKILHNIKKKNSVCVHIRRSDYVNNRHFSKIYNVCDLKYYQKSIKKMREKLKKPYFFIFSDEPEWAKKNFFNLKDVCIVDINQKDNFHVYDFELMKNCKHFIISNSSFSWWACWLGSKNKSIVIAPKKWFKDNLQKRNPILKTWIKV